MLKTIILGLIGIFVALAVYIRLAPSDPAVWNADITADGYVPQANWAAFCPETGSRDAIMTDDLAPLDAVAMATPRTTRLAGSVAEGRITWVTRSKVMGFPDYTTAAIRQTDAGPQLCVVGRLRFGQSDLGVNAKRVGGWLMQAYGLNEAPAMRWNP